MAPGPANSGLQPPQRGLNPPPGAPGLLAGAVAGVNPPAAGATIGGVAGSVAGHGIKGAGIGGAAGAGAGLASVLFKRGPDAALPQGTMVEMILDRDIGFQPAELRF